MKYCYMYSIIGIVLFFSLLKPINAFVKMVAVVTKVETQTDLRKVNVTCVHHQPESLTNHSMDFEIEFLRTIEEMKLKVNYYNTALNGITKRPIMHRQINLCLFLLRPNSDRLLKSMYDYLKERGHLPSSCPIAPDSYYMRNIRSSDFPVPAFLPETEFIFELIYISGLRDKPVIEHRFHGKLVRIVDKLFA